MCACLFEHAQRWTWLEPGGCKGQGPDCKVGFCACPYVCPCKCVRARATQRRGCNVIIRDRNTLSAQRANSNQCGRAKERKGHVGTLVFPENIVYLLIIIFLGTYLYLKSLATCQSTKQQQNGGRKAIEYSAKRPRALQGETGRSGRGPCDHQSSLKGPRRPFWLGPRGKTGVEQPGMRSPKRPWASACGQVPSAPPRSQNEPAKGVTGILPVPTWQHSPTGPGYYPRAPCTHPLRQSCAPSCRAVGPSHATTTAAAAPGLGSSPAKEQ